MENFLIWAFWLINWWKVSKLVPSLAKNIFQLENQSFNDFWLIGETSFYVTEIFTNLLKRESYWLDIIFVQQITRYKTK